MMKLVGEKINGTRAQIGKAVAERNAELIQTIARRQQDAGADWLDVNAGTRPDSEAEDLVWLVNTVQEVASVPLCLDSPNPKALAAALGVVRQTPLINSVSGEPNRLSGILPLVAEHGTPVIALCMDDKGIPSTAQARLDVVRRVLDATRREGIPDNRVYVDPLVTTIATNTEGVNIVLATMRAVRAEFPETHLISGLSNVSFGLPVRALINRTFLILALAAGLDTVIADPLDGELRAAILTADLLLGRDRHCLQYTRAYRAGLLEKKPAATG